MSSYVVTLYHSLPHSLVQCSKIIDAFSYYNSAILQSFIYHQSDLNASPIEEVGERCRALSVTMAGHSVA